MHETSSQLVLARIPLQALPLLGTLRLHAGLRVSAQGSDAWLRWPAGDETVIARLHAIPGVQFFAERQDKWYPQRSRLPSYDLPATAPSTPLDQVLLPAELYTQLPSSGPVETCPVRLVPEERQQPTRALLCTLAVLERWADQAPSAQIERLEGAHMESEVLLLGDSLPHLPGNRRFWGDRLLLPLGAHVEPAVSEDALLEAWGATAGELVLFDGERAEIVPASALMPLSRASIRLAVRGDK
jgi:hypothetical protein